MKKLYVSLLAAFLLFINIPFVSAQIDTIKVTYQFSSPCANPWGLTCDGNDLFISDSKNGKIYRTTYTGQLLDSIEIENCSLHGLTYFNGSLWAMNTSKVGDTLVGTSVYPLFAVYRLEQNTGLKLDSVMVKGPYPSTQSGDFFGICSQNNKLYVSFRGYFGPCLWEYDFSNQQGHYLCCTHFLGMTSLNNIIWGIRDNGNILSGSDGSAEFWKFFLPFLSTDITYGSGYFWAVDTVNNMIRQLEEFLPVLSVADTEHQGLHIYPNPVGSRLFIAKSWQQDNVVVIIRDQKAAIVRELKLDAEAVLELPVDDLPAGIYYLTVVAGNEVFSRKFVKPDQVSFIP